MTNPDKRSTTSLLSDAITHTSTLVCEEINLAKTEVSESLSKAAVAVGLLIGAVVISLTALDVLVAALVVALTDLGLAPGWAALLVGVAFAAVAFLMVKKGIGDLKASSFAPRRAFRNTRRDADNIKEKVSGK